MLDEILYMKRIIRFFIFLYHRRKGMIFIVLISKAEKKALSERFPKAQFVRTMVQRSDRGHYYCVEEPYLMRTLRDLRRENVIEEHPPRKKEKKYWGKNNNANR